MKIFTLFLFSLISANCIIPHTESKIDKVTIFYMPLAVETPIRVNCESFEKAKETPQIVITDIIYLNKIQKFLKELQVSKINTPPDTRIKMLIHFENGVEESLCFGESGSILYNGILYKYNSKFVKYIRSIINKNKPTSNSIWEMLE